MRSLTRAGRAAVVGAAGLAMVTALAACSSDSGTPAASTTSSGGGTGDCTAPGVTADSVKVGIMFPETGPSAPSFAGFNLGAQARFDKANAEGGVNGRKIETEIFDDMGDGAAQTTAARNAVSSSGIFGLAVTSRVDTAFDYLEQESIPVTAINITPSSTDRNVFGVTGAIATTATTTAAAVAMKDLGVTKVFVLAHNSPGSLGGSQNFIKGAEAEGLEVVGTQFDIPLGQFDATSTAVKIRDSGADGIYSPLLVDSSVAVLTALKQQSVTLKGDNISLLYNPSVVQQAGAAVNGSWTSTLGNKPLELTSDPAVSSYIADLKKYQPTADPYQGFTTPGWMVADAFVKGLEEAGDCLSRANYIDKLRAVSEFDSGGLGIEKISWVGDQWTPNGPPPNCYWFVQVVDGQFKPADAVSCGKIISTS